ncbi:MAG: methylenetetrahydrofolate reductase [NAD(P)H] [Planctomycetaceae bacterium]|nr:methylenetetrahydrofolate reductase [NAD(P)H] [Planctomycetaceae bacterium]MBP60436.1 methylenetetrahydrofolate reductase [NAD(P)H] [Planctomycetaceae bacterium]
MKLGDYYQSGRMGLSFELFPPKTPAGEAALMKHCGALMEFHPDVVTCTYGAGGSTREKTLEIVRQVKQKFGVPVASHLTCVGSTKQQLRDYLDAANRQQVDYIVALRGDPPRGEKKFRPVSDGLSHANELVSLIRSEYSHFGIAVGGYPEMHQEAPDPHIDLENLKRKVDAGADIVITQLFYNNEAFFVFRDRCDKIGLEVPLIPGILPVTNYSQVHRLASLCGANLPRRFVQALADCEDDAEQQFQIGVDYAIAQVNDLIQQQVAGMHFYVLNKSQAASAVLAALGRSEKTT